MLKELFKDNDKVVVRINRGLVWNQRKRAHREIAQAYASLAIITSLVIL